ncbi:MAG: hypothetical protein ACJ71H_19305 [Nitrososphaeraceae archaeon]
MTRFTSYYPNVEFPGSKYLGSGPYNTLYQVCDYCTEYKKIHTLNRPVYYRRGVRRKLDSCCSDCNSGISKDGRLTVVDYKYGGYYEILDAVKDSDAEAISFEDAVKKAFNRNQNVSQDGFGAEVGVSMLKRYLGGRRIVDNNVSFDDKRL